LFSYSRVIYGALTTGVAVLCVFFALQAGYVNLVIREHGLWKTMYRETLLERNGLSDQLANAQHDLSQAQDKAGDQQLEIDQLTGSVASLGTQRDLLRVQNGQLESALLQLTAEFQTSNQSFGLLKEQSRNLSLRLNESTERLAESTARSAELEGLLGTAEAELVDLRRNITAVKQELDNLAGSNERLLALLANASDEVRVFEAGVSLQGEIYREYDWYYLGQKHWSKGTSAQRGTGFNRSEYLSLAVGPHWNDTDEDSFAKVLNIPCQDVKRLADYLSGQAATDIQRVNNILKFVQYLPYIYDAPDDNYVRHPLETLVEGGGDCEDTSVLAAKLLLSAGNEGYPVVLLTVDSNADGEADHMMIGVSVAGASGDFYEVNGTRYYVCETTSTTYGVGFKPSNYSIMAAIPVG